MSKNIFCTPLHIASLKGNFEICKLIIDNVEDKNPSAFFDPKLTPLYWATLRGYHQIADYIKSKIENWEHKTNKTEIFC